MALWSALLSRPARTPLSTRPSLTLYFLLAGAFLLTLVPHMAQFPIWISVLVVGAMAVRSILAIYRLPLPSTTFCGIMALLLLGAIFWQFQTVFGRDAGTAFTAGLLAIKFFELRGPRDIALIIFSCFFVVMSALLYSQVLELFIYCLIMMWVLTALLLRVHTGDLPEDRLLRMLHRSGIIFLQALPLTLFLFFFFPRYSGKLGITLDETSTGLTDTVRPGSIARLAQNDSEAMYVRFSSGTSATPTPDTMYWRAMVLWDYDGGTWTPGPLAGEPGVKPSPAPGSDQFEQEITIHPHNRRWLFALDAPITSAGNKSEPVSWSITLNGDILQTSGRLEHKARYDVTSASALADKDLSETEKSIGTGLPDDQIDPEVKNLADRLYQEKPDTRDYVRTVLHYFRHENFVYSTAPGAEGQDWLPVFLFKTKTGFCEHFASAFAVLMRLKKIPARLVVGYQGAEYNPYADLYTVKQSNAHAWDEVWVEAENQPAASHKGHWMRVDPTAILGLAEQNLPANSSEGDSGENLSIQAAHHQLTFSETYLPKWVRNGFKEMQLRREEVEANWDNLVLSYDPQTQNRLAQAMGLGQRARFELLFASLVAAGICAIIFLRWIKRKPPISPVEIFYATFCRNMAQRGIPRAIWEGPLAYTERVAEAFPDNKPAIQRVGSIVAQTRYAAAPTDPATPHDLKTLLTLITASQAASISREKR